jgi:tetratricopeptide (TPR) repeat protein
VKRSHASVLVAWLMPWLSHTAVAAPLDEAVSALQSSWEVVRYQTPASERERRFEALVTQAHQTTLAFPGHSEPLIWEGILLSAWAAERGGFGGLGLVRRAKGLYEQALSIDARALDGSVYNGLGVLYYKAPGWPLSFGDKDKARQMLRKALEISPQGLDANFFYADYLVETDHEAEAVPYLERALAAAPRPGRQIADTGRREEARALLARIRTR